MSFRLSYVRPLLVAAVAMLAIACQPSDDPRETVGQGEQAAPEEPPVGVVAGGVPQTLGGLFDRVDEPAGEWQSGARPAEILTRMSEESVGSARVTFVSGGADRFLVVNLSDDGMSQDAPSLAGLELGILPSGAVDEIEPADALADAPALIDAAAPALDECGFGDEVTSVLYTTGAPAAWTGDAWAEAPSWRGLLRVGDAGTVHVDPRSGELSDDGCRPSD